MSASLPPLYHAMNMQANAVMEEMYDDAMTAARAFDNRVQQQVIRRTQGGHTGKDYRSKRLLQEETFVPLSLDCA